MNNKTQLENAVLTAGEIVDSFVLSEEELPRNKTEQYLYPYQLPMISRDLPYENMNDMSFLKDPRYSVYLVRKRISGSTLVTEGIKSEVIHTANKLNQPGTRFVLPDGIKIQDLVDQGFLLKFERGYQSLVPYLGDPYENKGFYDPRTGESKWPKDFGFKNSRFALKHLKRFSFVDRFGSDQGSFLCPARFKSPELKHEACLKVLGEIKSYKYNFIEQIFEPLVDILFKKDMTEELKEKLKTFMNDICEKYYSIIEKPTVRETNFSKEEWSEYLTTILTNLLLRDSSLTDGATPVFMKECVNEILGEEIYNVVQDAIAPRVEDYVNTRTQGNFKVAETSYNGYLDLIDVDNTSFGEQEVLLNAMESGMFTELANNLNPDIFSVENPSDGEKSDLLLMLIPYLAVNITVFDKTLFSMKFLLRHEIASDIFNIAKAVGIFELAESTSNDIIKCLEIYPITERALSSNAEITEEYNLYMVLDNLSSLYGLAAPWYSSKGNAEQIKLYKNSYIDQLNNLMNVYEDSCATLIEEGFLLKIAEKEKKERLPMLYGGINQ